jgi:hypothetical protein
MTEERRVALERLFARIGDVTSRCVAQGRTAGRFERFRHR